jgi:L-glyceraldehyde 3-phosphate reductase
MPQLRRGARPSSAADGVARGRGDVEHRPLGASGFEVSALALGSWRTYERMTREDGVAVMTAAREAGIDFLDDARYDDETGQAPLPTGHSEVIFGELFRATGWARDEVLVSNKLWWEFWPEQTAAEELDASLRRMQFDHLDLVYSEQPPDGLALEELVAAVTGLVAAGKARAWGVLNWPPELIEETGRIATAEGVPPPCAAQLAYSLASRSSVESEETLSALDRCGASVVASEVLARGALTGRGRSGRAAEAAESPRLAGALDLGNRLSELAADLGTTPVRLAIAFTLANQHVATALFGASRPEQVRENAGAVDLLARMGETELRALRALAA